MLTTIEPGLTFRLDSASGIYTSRVLRPHRNSGYWETEIIKGGHPALLRSIQVVAKTIIEAALNSASELTVTKMHIASRRGENKQPSSGDAWFNDGKNYGWLLSPEGDNITFFADRKVGSEWQRVSFTASKRAAAVANHLGMRTAK